MQQSILPKLEKDKSANAPSRPSESSTGPRDSLGGRQFHFPHPQVLYVLLANYCKWKPLLPCQFLGLKDYNATVMLGNVSWWANQDRWQGDDGNWVVGLKLAKRDNSTGESEYWRFSYEDVEAMFGL